jgi:hypothetical protein
MFVKKKPIFFVIPAEKKIGALLIYTLAACVLRSSIQPANTRALPSCERGGRELRCWSAEAPEATAAQTTFSVLFW